MLDLFSLSSYDFDLPDSLIALYPKQKRDEAKLLVVDKFGNIIKDTFFYDIGNYINEGDLLILNDSKVIKSKLYGFNKTNNRIFEINLVYNIDNKNYLSFIKNRKKLKKGEILVIKKLNLNSKSFNESINKNKKVNTNYNSCIDNNNDNCSNLEIEIVEFIEDKVKIKFNKEVSYELLHEYGEIPIPPYLKRKSCEIDEIYYQTVYSKEYGSFASPTAGLHFTKELIKKLEEKKVIIKYLTLHVGAGTFNPIRTDDINKHKMHEETYFFSKDLVEKINETKKNAKRVIACGTTTLRALEGNFLSYGYLKEGLHKTDIFIKPGFKFNVVDSLITNFHTPKSTLLILVCAFAGYSNIFKYYDYAKNNDYKFFSYGDAMFIL